MNYLDTVAPNRIAIRATRPRVLCVALALMCTLSACGNGKEKKAGQTLASVNGEEITVLQLNEELNRSGVAPAQQETAKKQLLESLIERQLLQNEASKEKIDRDPKVVQAIERAKALIIAQAYMQKRVASVTRPAKAEVNEYFEKHPELFTHRKTIDMRQLVLATKDLTDAAKEAIDNAKSLEEVAGWLENQNVKFARAQSSRSSAEMPPELVSKLLKMSKGERFIIREGERSTIVSIVDIRETPATLEASSGQIEQYLYNKKVKEVSDAELARLRAAAKIEYANPADRPAAPAAAAPKAGEAAPSDATSRGVSGLK